ncbi:ChrR family anti-sigma-E factor [Ensifer sp.]|jgi:putative transcriptional regulator|uniref:ChrR family anti-sigma-E factor n=1 Tax=Ensifer sp. TaxID=1872086 RepID=UPI002E165A59|nr:ChrR family anti-sigma-E factor [Ensifer sp.]
MSVRHHVSDELLLAYAAGSLEEGWRLAVATHLALCPESRSRLALIENAAGQLFEDIVVEQPMTTSFDQLRQRLEGHRTPESGAVRHPTGRRAGGVPMLPEPLRSYVGGDVETLKWKALGRGAFHILIKTGDATTTARLLRIPAGRPVPEHGHGGRELTVVLAGSYHDGDRLFARGDLEEADASIEHQPVATPLEDCICLAVTDAPLKFKSWLVRLVQPVLGI